MYGDALTTKDRIKDRLQITANTWDALFDNLILAVSARIEQLCGRRFILATYTNELHDGSDVTGGGARRFLVLKNTPVQALSSLQYQAGPNSNPQWTDFDEDEYTLDRDGGIIHVPSGLPRGAQNIRATYTGGYSGYSIGIANYWLFNVVPTGLVDGSNLAFGLPEAAQQIVVYADGLREAAANVTFEPGDDSFTLAAGRAPYSTITVDYLRVLAEGAEEGAGAYLPADLVEVCEEAVIRLYKRRDSEGRTSETFGESSITWARTVFTDEDLRVISAHKRGYAL